MVGEMGGVIEKCFVHYSTDLYCFLTDMLSLLIVCLVPTAGVESCCCCCCCNCYAAIVTAIVVAAAAVAAAAAAAHLSFRMLFADVYPVHSEVGCDNTPSCTHIYSAL